MPLQDTTMPATLTVVSFLLFHVMATLAAKESTKNVIGQCVLPLGMEEGKIPDDAITASSSYEMKSVGPQNARIRQEKNGGAWCPKAQISSAIREYLEIDLTRNHLIAWTETQGRFGNGQGQEYAEAFFLEYFRDETWHQYKNLKGDRVLRGNSNTYLVEKQKLDLPFVASRVRFVPYSQHPRTVCMRVEIYGCVWEQHVAKYTAPRGSANGPEGCNVKDSSYDGTEFEDLLINGLGQLTDGILGESSEIVTPWRSDTNWVGWNDREFIELVFEFQDVREFENCSIHVAHLPEFEIEAFSTLHVWFSIDGKNYQPDPKRLETFLGSSKLLLPSNSLGTELLSIPLQSKIGRFVKLELRTSSKWLLISEISFDTGPGMRNLTTREFLAVERSLQADRNESGSRYEPDTTGNSHVLGKAILGINKTIYELNENASTPNAFPVGNSQTYIGLVSGLLTMFALFLTCTAFLMKQRGRNKVALLQKHTALLCGSSTSGIAINAKDVKLPNPVVVNGLSINYKPAGLPSDSGKNSLRVTERHTDHSTVYERTYNLFSDKTLREEPGFSICNTEYPDKTTESVMSTITATETSAMASSTTAMTTAITNTATVTTTTSVPLKKANHFHSGKVNQKIHEGYYAATDILAIKRREQSSVSSLFTPLRIRENDGYLPRTPETYDIQSISRHRLRILDKLGEGNFGLVHLCEAKGIPDPEVGSIQNRQRVILRSLWRGVVDSLRLDFTKDMYVLASLRDPNIARIIALVEEEPFGAVFEYGQYGDLPSFFDGHEKLASGVEVPLGYEYRVNFAMQIASGMKYLETANVPHCDLAARNCIVGQGLTVKISDHAMYCSKYDRHYYVDGSYAKIPLRWMSWEAVLLGKRTSYADVWSFAVTVWEILTSCKEMPYADWTSEQVLENSNRWYQGTGGHLLSRPSCCSDDLYRVMTKCWNKQVENRPTFEEIYLYLNRLVLD